MKNNSTKTAVILFFAVLFAFVPTASAQGIFDSLSNKVKEKANQKKEEMRRKAEKAVEQKIDEAGDAATNGVTNSVKSQNNGGGADKPKDSASKAQSDKQIWGFVAMTVQSRDKWGKTTSRVYVSEITELSDKLYKSKYDTDPTNFKPMISKYFKETVIAAAKERGEEVSEPDDYSLVGMTVKFSVDDYVKKDFYTTAYKYGDKSVLDAPYQEQLDYAKNARRPVYYFRWDPTGKNVEADLEKEKTRTSGALPQ